LILRPFGLSDAPDVAHYAGDREIASTTLLIPHPYSVEDALAWLATHHDSFQSGRSVACAVTLRETGELAGAIGLSIAAGHDRAELGYWIGRPFWGRGFATEAGLAMVRYGFEELPLNRIDAYHFARNPASGRVLQKIGMTYEGTARQLYKKWGGYEDCPLYSILRAEFESAPTPLPANNQP
jgi:RimJ/RimL family protein N-acetyltransferase